MIALVVGACGMLGRAVVEAGNDRGINIHARTFEELDITEEESLENVFAETSPTVVINCAAYTDVDKAEADEREAYKGNALVPEILARVAKKHNVCLIHISTDYIFAGDSEKPYSINSPASPKSIYGKTKWAGECAITESGVEYIIVRTSWLFGDGRNFVDTICNFAKERDELKVVNDQTGRATYAPDLAQALWLLAESSERGVFHFANSGTLTWYDLAKEAIKLRGLECNISPATTAEFPRPAPRPEFSILDTSRYEKTLNTKIRSWQDALVAHIKNDSDRGVK